MTTTAKFCDKCKDQLRSLPDTALTEEQRVFLNAGDPKQGSTPDYFRSPKSDDGTCAKCAGHKIVTWYEL